MGEIRDVGALMDNHGFPAIAPMEDTCLLLMRFESGAAGSLALTWSPSASGHERSSSSWVTRARSSSIPTPAASS